jgi:hypothetical protein
MDEFLKDVTIVVVTLMFLATARFVGIRKLNKILRKSK